jgi:glycosyltransferase involved in cell wall biosynthesis
MHITLVEPFFTGSHQQWALQYQKHSQHSVHILSLKGKYWKWRMFGGAVTLAQKFAASPVPTDLFLLSDMTDLCTFSSLLPSAFRQIPLAIYFHENQITYPWSPTDPDISLQRNNQYGFINYTSALAADQVFFNSEYHKNSFIEGLTPFLKQFPDHRGLDNIKRIEAKSKVLSLGLELKSLPLYNVQKHQNATLLWNHRWEYDKNPEEFFQLLFRLKEEKIDFKLIVLGESYKKSPAIFAEAEKRLADEIIHFGFAPSKEKYIQLLQAADILPVTGYQDFFGISVVEAIYAGCYPLLPNRLAYPQHIPAAKQQEHLYTSTEELYQKLKETILKIDQIRPAEKLSNFVAQYDWSNLAVVYDQTFSQIKQE